MPDSPHGERSSRKHLRTLRGLIERNLVDRAAALADSRTPGAGQIVRLVHEWGSLSPAARRQRLDAIGPEDLARFRSIAELQPDLARVLEDLESRGVILPSEAGGVELPTAQPLTTANDAGGFASESVGVSPPATRVDLQPPTPQPLEASEPSVEDLVTEMTAKTAAEGVDVSQASVEAAKKLFAEMPEPNLDLGLPDIEEFLEDEAEHREEAIAKANELMDRVRARVDASAVKATRHPEPPKVTVTDGAPHRLEPVEDAASLAAAQSALDADRDPVPDDDPIHARLVEETVVVLNDVPYHAVYAACRTSAEERDLPLVVLSADDLGRQKLYGCLVRAGEGVDVAVGELPRALASGAVVVLRGRLSSKAIARLQGGFCDIPATNATVKLHPNSQLVCIDA